MIGSVSVVVTPTQSEDEPTVEENETFNVVYHGHISIDRRYVPPVFHWIAKQIVRKGDLNMTMKACLTKSSLKFLESDNEQSIFMEHTFDSIYRLSRLRHCNLDNFLAFITVGKNDTNCCGFYILECESVEMVRHLIIFKVYCVAFQPTFLWLRGTIDKIYSSLFPTF